MELMGLLPSQRAGECSYRARELVSGILPLPCYLGSGSVTTPIPKIGVHTSQGSYEIKCTYNTPHDASSEVSGGLVL